MTGDLVLRFWQDNYNKMLSEFIIGFFLPFFCSREDDDLPIRESADGLDLGLKGCMSTAVLDGMFGRVVVFSSLSAGCCSGCKIP